MSNFFISYDLIKEKNYPVLIAELQKLGATRILLSHWFVNLNNTAVQVRDHLAQFIDYNDQLLVVDCSRNTWAARNLPQGVVDVLTNKWALLVG